MKTTFHILIALLLFTTLGGAARAATELPMASPPADVRVLIDVSGSMKKNDPHNLRRPALDLLVRLFPASAQAGVWSFGHDVAVMVPLGTVDARWRREGTTQAQRIHSNALHTDIPAALAAAMADAEALDAARRVSIILLTDGMVDVSKSAEVNAAARQRLIDEVAPRLRELGVHVHTVALSDEADHELLEQLAVVTGGISAVANDAAELQRIFVQALDAATPSEQLPLADNRFLVDSSVDELTALVFHDGAPMVMVAPDGSRHSVADHGADFAWHRDAGYELVTITRPYEGEWHLEGDAERGSRITIVSDLSLAATRLPDNLFPGEPPTVSALLREDGNPLNRPELLALIDFSAQVTREATSERPAEAWRVPLQRDGDAFMATLPMLAVEPGHYELIVLADGKTFQRSLTQRITVRDHFELQISATDEMPARQRLLVRAVNPAVAVDTAVARATIRGGDASEPQPLALMTPAGGQGWEVLLDAAAERREVNWEVTFQLPRRGVSGDALAAEAVEATWRSGAIALDGGQVVRAPVPPLELTQPEPRPVAEEPVPSSEPEVSASIEDQPAAADEPATQRPWWLYGALVVGNLLLIALAVFAYRKLLGAGPKTPAALDEGEPGTGSGNTTGNAAEPSATLPPLDSLDLPLDAIDLDPASDKR